MANPALSERYLAAAVRVLTVGRGPAGALRAGALREAVRLAGEHHAALYSLGRLEGDAGVGAEWPARAIRNGQGTAPQATPGGARKVPPSK